MVDHLASTETCRVCGALLNQNQFQVDGLCSSCAGASSPQATEDLQAAASVPIGLAPQEDVTPDPDNPGWGPPSGIGVWVASVATIIVIPVLAVVAWYLIEQGRGATVPGLGDKDQLLEWLKSPNLLLVQVLSTIVAHGLTLAICWAVVTKFGGRPFWASLGWNWAGHSFWYWAVFSACVILALLLVSQVLSRFLPQSEENSFAELLKSSQQVRIAIAVLATFTAPLVEETVYRGILFSSLRRSLGVSVTVVLVTVMFAGVHVLQYFGAWVSVAGLTLLSLALTLIRARTKSILPCVLIHTLNNAFFSVIIVLNKAT